MTEDGGPAFGIPARTPPRGPHSPHLYEPQAGMSLRDWFAGQALVGLVNKDNVGLGAGDETDAAATAWAAYRIADAMIAQRRES